MPRRDHRSDQAKAYRHWYNLAAWKRARRTQLADQPLCERCKARGFIVAATVVNHRQAHKGDWQLFIDPDNHQSLCAPCHDQAVQSEERGGGEQPNRIGFRRDVDADGWPIDPRHRALRQG